MRTTRLARSAALGITFLSILPRAMADVWIVDASGNGDFLDIQPAVDVAHGQDVLIVRAGIYGSFVIDDESMHVLAETGAIVRVEGTVGVFRLAHGKQVSLHGLEVHAASEGRPALELEDDVGSVRIASCVLQGRDGSDGIDTWGTEGARVTRCRDVSFDSCGLAGGDSGHFDWCSDGIEGGRALFVSESRAAVSRSALTGGTGGDGDEVYLECWMCGYSDAGKGGDAVRLAPDSFLFVGGSILLGGGGGIGWDCTKGWDLCDVGGDGIRVQDSTSAAKILDSEISGGPGGGSCGPGDDVDGPNVEFLSGPAKHMDAGRLAREGEMVPL